MLNTTALFTLLCKICSAGKVCWRGNAALLLCFITAAGLIARGIYVAVFHLASYRQLGKSGRKRGALIAVGPLDRQWCHRAERVLLTS